MSSPVFAVSQTKSGPAAITGPVPTCVAALSSFAGAVSIVPLPPGPTQESRFTSSATGEASINGIAGFVNVGVVKFQFQLTGWLPALVWTL